MKNFDAPSMTTGQVHAVYGAIFNILDRSVAIQNRKDPLAKVLPSISDDIESQLMTLKSMYGDGIYRIALAAMSQVSVGIMWALVIHARGGKSDLEDIINMTRESVLGDL